MFQAGGRLHRTDDRRIRAELLFGRLFDRGGGFHLASLWIDEAHVFSIRICARDCP